MKKIYLLTSIMLLFFSCSKDSDTGSGCGYHNGKPLSLGPQGGCYYTNDNGNKIYVARSECKCD